MRIEDIENIKEGDYVRIVKCAYPSTNQYFLGKVSRVECLIDGFVRLERWGNNIFPFLLEKVDENAEDIDMEFTEDRVLKLTDLKYIREGGLVRIVKRDPSFPDDCTIGKVSKVGHIKNRQFWLERWDFYVDGDSIDPVDNNTEDIEI